MEVSGQLHAPAATPRWSGGYGKDINPLSRPWAKSCQTKFQAGSRLFLTLAR